MEIIEILELLDNAFVLILGTALLKAIYVLFKMVIQTNRNTEDIAELQDFCGLKNRRLDDGYRSSSQSPRGGT